MAKKATKKTAARRNTARKPARRRVRTITVYKGEATIGARIVPKYENMDVVRIVGTGVLGVVVAVASHYRGDPEYCVRFRNPDGLRADRYYQPADIEAAL